MELTNHVFLTNLLKTSKLRHVNCNTPNYTMTILWAPSLYCERLDAQIDRYLVHLFQDHDFFLFGPATGHSLVASTRRDPATPSSVLLTPSVSSPFLDANRGIDPLAIGSLDWLTLRLPRMNQTWKGESTKFQVKKGY